ncbi:MAG: hypothetical protein ACRD0P_21750, partial [Stackebrandtia sp.]
MRAVLLATTPGAGAMAADKTVAARLVGQLREHGVSDITVITRTEYRSAVPAGVTLAESSGVRQDLRLLAEIAAEDQAVLLACADTLLDDTAASAVLSDPTDRAGVLVGDYDVSRQLDAPVYRDRGMVLSVGTSFHEVSQPNASTSGVLKVTAPYLDDLREALRRVIDQGASDLATSADAWTLTVLAVVRQGTKLVGYAVPGLHYGRVPGEASARRMLAQIEATDADAILLDQC